MSRIVSQTPPHIDQIDLISMHQITISEFIFV